MEQNQKDEARMFITAVAMHALITKMKSDATPVSVAQDAIALADALINELDTAHD